MSITFIEKSLDEKEKYKLREVLRSTQWGDLNLSMLDLIEVMEDGRGRI